jgi:hypothetical protein
LREPHLSRGRTGWLRNAVLAGVLCLGLLSGAVAEAHEKTFHSRITSEYAQPTVTADSVHGLVGSKRAACAPNRVVLVYGTNPHSGFPYDTVFIGRTTSDSSGAYTVAIGATQQRSYYYAEAKRKLLLRTKKHKHICGAATSYCIAGHSCPALLSTSGGRSPASRSQRDES